MQLKMVGDLKRELTAAVGSRAVARKRPTGGRNPASHCCLGEVQKAASARPAVMNVLALLATLRQFHSVDLKVRANSMKALIAAIAMLGIAPTDTPLCGTAYAQRACCKVCHAGKACGNSCISRDKECHRPRGCACDG